MEVYKMKGQLFASSGSCSNPIKEVYGKVDGITFTSNEFTGTKDSQKFWDDLREYAKSINMFIELRY